MHVDRCEDNYDKEMAEKWRHIDESDVTFELYTLQPTQIANLLRCARAHTHTQNTTAATLRSSVIEQFQLS